MSLEYIWNRGTAVKSTARDAQIVICIILTGKEDVTEVKFTV